ncbi:MAG TPA: RsmE family RNA methyltransferase, partial [Brevibacterium sp.]|nr:RsmE family RNA methyltransferase [Brevibacterium sp.]
GIPEVGEPASTAQLLSQLRERTADGASVLVLHEQESVGLMSLAEQLRSASEDGLEEIVVIVGPEGGIDPEELAQLREAGARSVLLGPEVLRSSTAGPAAIAVLSALVGRWG